MVVRRTAMICLAAATVLTAATASAQERVYVFEQEVIRGEIEKPEAFYILSPSNLEYESLDAEESFLPELYETVESPPF